MPADYSPLALRGFAAHAASAATAVAKISLEGRAKLATPYEPDASTNTRSASDRGHSVRDAGISVGSERHPELRRNLELSDCDAARAPTRVERQTILHARGSRGVGTPGREEQRRTAARRAAARDGHLQHLLSRVRHAYSQHAAHVDRDRTGRRPDSSAHARGGRGLAAARRPAEACRRSRGHGPAGPVSRIRDRWST